MYIMYRQVYDYLQPFLFSKGIGIPLAYLFFIAFYTSRFIIPCAQRPVRYLILFEYRISSRAPGARNFE